MHELYELKEKLCKELKEYSRKDITAGSLTMIDTLAHAAKNLDKIIERYEEEEEMYSGMPSHEGGSMRGSYEGMNTYSRRMSRDGSYRGRGRNARRDAMGRYSSEYSGDDEMMTELQDLMRNAPDDRTRQKIQSIIYKMGEM